MQDTARRRSEPTPEDPIVPFPAGRAQWSFLATAATATIAAVAAVYALLYPKILTDLRAEWKKDDVESRAVVTESIAKEFAGVRAQLDDLKAGAARLDAKVDRLTERVGK